MYVRTKSGIIWLPDSQFSIGCRTQAANAHRDAPGSGNTTTSPAPAGANNPDPFLRAARKVRGCHYIMQRGMVCKGYGKRVGMQTVSKYPP